MNGAGYGTGCAGAVWTNGDFSPTYCAGDNHRFPWWGICCKWENSSCVPRFTSPSPPPPVSPLPPSPPPIPPPIPPGAP
eukprot:4394015-Prymnesium_polylepis.1